MTISSSINGDLSKDQNKIQEYWVSDEEHLFVKAKLLKTISNDKLFEVEISLPNSSSTKIKKVDSVFPSNASYFDNVNNLSQLPNLNEPSVLNNLQHRFKDGNIYTYSGLFLVAVNPYKHDDNLYTDSMVQKYHNNSSNSGLIAASNNYSTVAKNKSNINELQPHVFAIAQEALHNLFSEHKDQSILVTGESGAGKTENTKKILQYLTNVTQHANVSSENPESINFEDKILESNPILESFGNATTVKNNNSSRFGKFIKIFFNTEKKVIERTFIDWYLLEKSRVTFIDSANERNYHIFYQLLKGIQNNPNNSIFDNLNINSLNYNDWTYLKTNKVDININDLKEFENLLQAFKKIGFSEVEQNDIFKILAAILHLGNINFSNGGSLRNSDKQSVLSEKDKEHLKFTADLLGIDDIKEFEISITSPKVTAGKEKVKQKRTYKQSKAIIDSLAKIIYEKLFGYIVSKVNDSLKHNSKSQFEEFPSSTNFIGLLDIAGFEIFEKNSLEQLLINFTNENLQQFFNHHMFILEQEEYMKENITWNFKDYGLDLQHTIDLLSAKPKGILPLLDEETIMPNSNDNKFYDRLLTTVADHSRFQRVKVSQKNKTNTKNNDLKNFIIKHYAGDVEYDSADWLHKNKEPLNDHLKQLLLFSKSTLIKDYLFIADKSQTSFKTQSQRHINQLSSLISNLNDANPLFIRCILPNRTKSSSIFSKKLVLDQLTCNGVLEGIRISREGFPNRISFKEFVNTYGILFEIKSNSTLSFKERTSKIIESIKQLSASSDDYKIGKNKILFRSGKLAILEELKQSKMAEIFGWFIAKIKGDKLRHNLQQELKKIYSAKVLTEAFTFHDKHLINNGWFKLFTAVKPLLEDDFDSDNTKSARNKKLSDILSKNQELVDMVNTLETKLDTVKESSTKITDINFKLEEDITKSQSENEDLIKKLESIELSFKEDNEEKDGLIKKLNETQISLNNKVKGLTTSVEELQLKEIQLNTSIKSADEQVDSIKKKLTEKMDELNMLTKENQTFKNSKDDLEKLILSLKNEIKQKDAEVEKLQLELKHSDKRIDSTLNSLEKNFDEANNKVKVLIEENQTARLELSKLKLEKVTLEKTISAVSNQLSKSEIKVKSLEIEIKELQKFKKDNLEQQTEKHMQQVAELQSKHDILAKEYKQLQSSYRILESSLQQNEEKLNQVKHTQDSHDSTNDLTLTVNNLKTQLYNEKLDNDYIHQKTVSIGDSKEYDTMNPNIIVAELMDLKHLLKREQKEKTDSLSRVKFLRTKLAGANMDNEELSHKVKNLMNILYENKISLDEIDGNKIGIDDGLHLVKRQLNQSILDYDQLKEKLDKEILMRENSEHQRQVLIKKMGALVVNVGNSNSSIIAGSFNSEQLSNKNSNDILALKTQLVDLKDTLDLSSTNLLKAEQKIIGLQQNESSLKMTVISLNKDLEASNKQNQLYFQSIQDYKHDYQNLSDEILEFEIKLKNSQLRINEQNEKLFKMESILEDQKSELNDLRKDSVAKEDIIVDLEDSISSKEIDLEKLSQLNELLKDDIQHMKATLKDFSRDSDLISKIEALNGKLSRMSRDEIELNKKISSLEYELDNLDKENALKIAELTSQNNHYLAQNNQLLSLNQDLKKNILELTEANTVNNNEIDKLNEILDANVVEKANLLKEKDALMDFLDIKDTDIENYISEITGFKKTNEEINEKLSLKKEALIRHEELINKLNDENSRLQENLNGLKENLIDLEKENDGLGTENEELKDHIKDIGSQLNGRSFERDSWNGKLADMNNKLIDVTNSKFEHIKENKKLHIELDEVSTQLDKCIAKVDILDAENQNLTKNLTSRDNAVKNLNNELQDEKNRNRRNELANNNLEKKILNIEQELELWKSRYYSKIRE
ncbi:hypothetical protein QEN19_001552 [Hanseniaspora menglaensis]